MIARNFALAVLALATMTLAACSEAPAPIEPDVRAVTEARTEIAAAEPRAIRAVDPAEASALLADLDARLRHDAVRVCREHGAAHCDWQVAYKHDPAFNAFATGKDQIVMLGGIFGAARNETEIAMVLAHEKAHHILDHIDETSRNAGIGAMIADFLVMAGAQWLAEALGLPLPASVVETVRRTATGAAAQAGVLVFSAANEREADALAAEILARAGFDPRDARGMVLAMGAMEKGDRTPSFLRTHPAGPERLAHWDAVSEAVAPRSM
jgi:predicted Zn-dependent protease